MTEVRDTHDSLAQVLDAFRTGQDVSEDDAMTIAKAELAAVRDERYSRDPRLRTPESSATQIETDFGA